MDSLALIRPAGANLQPPTRPVRVLGIDLGTTNSTVAEILWPPGQHEPLKVRCLEVAQPTEEGESIQPLVPSIVALHNGQVVIGEGAKRLRTRAAELGLEQSKNLFYEYKNDIGTKKTYHRAPAGFRSAAEIGGQVLEFLRRAALADDRTELSRVVVTVPASFQTAQRHDTLRAAELAGLTLSPGDLLDEPVAAFLDYAVGQGEQLLAGWQGPKTVVVFDFGGGTCDVAVFRITAQGTDQPLRTDTLSVSRYHRLGGGDIDAAILYEVLLPQVCEQNGLGPFDLSFSDKKKVLEPALLGAAESLKVMLSSEIAKRQRFGKYAGEDKTQIFARLPNVYTCQVGERELRLQSPRLTAAEFEAVLKPFLDRDLLYARETEYRLTSSIFAPLGDALDRCDLEAEEVDYCLLVGGSSLLPQAVTDLREFFPRAELLTYPDRDSIQTAVARGAAYHALALALFGRGLIQPVCHDSIGLRTAGGRLELIARGELLPYPVNGERRLYEGLAVPASALTGSVPLRVEVIAGDDERLLFSQIWQIAAPVEQGEPLSVEFGLDENQVLNLQLRLANKADATYFATEISIPLTNVVNPQAERLKIEALEESLRTTKLTPDEQQEKIIEIARAYADLGQHEKALEFLARVSRQRGGRDGNIINLMGIYAGELGDHERQEKFYREAARVVRSGTPLFNLALMQRKRRQPAAARESIEQAIALDAAGPYLVLRALIAEDEKDAAGRDQYLQEAIAAFDPLPVLSDWELGWYLTAARMLRDAALIDAAEQEQRRRKRQVKTTSSGDGLLPEQKSTIAKRNI